MVLPNNELHHLLIVSCGADSALCRVYTGFWLSPARTLDMRSSVTQEDYESLAEIRYPCLSRRTWRANSKCKISRIHVGTFGTGEFESPGASTLSKPSESFGLSLLFMNLPTSRPSSSQLPRNYLLSDVYCINYHGTHAAQHIARVCASPALTSLAKP